MVIIIWDGVGMNTKKVFGTLVGVNILQIVFTMVIIILMSDNNQNQFRQVLYGSCLFIGFNTFITILSYSFVHKVRNVNILESIKNLEALNSTLRMQRHDFLNQMQVVYGLLELEEYVEAKIYMNSIFKEIMKVSNALKTAQPAVNALLQAKLQMADKNGVDMYLDIKSDLKQLKMEPWELCKVLANIIDNGITALEGRGEGKELRIIIEQNTSNYLFTISNNGPRIPKNKIETIFTEGYSSKTEKGHGMGLTIVKSIMNDAGALIEVRSTDKETCFILTLPICA